MRDGTVHVRRQHRRWRGALLGAALLVAAAACGGDDGDADEDADAATTAATDTTDSAATTAVTDATGSTNTTAATTTTAETTDPPVASGGDVTVLVFNEIAGVDPVAATGAASADGQRMFALYGALVAYDAEQNEPVPVLAESLEPAADAATWTLTLRDGLVFSDGTPFDAAAVQANWQRAQVPENRSQAIGLASSITAMTVVDARTLEITLAAPNAHFDNGVARQALNYIASPAAIAGGSLATTPVGAGPFLLEQWTRDDRMVLTANPDWQGSDGPYIDTLTFRIVGDEDQRVDTFTTGDADLFYTAAPRSVQRALDDGAAGFASVPVSGGGTVVFNTAKPPFDDVRVRRAVAIGVDAAVVVDTIRPGATVATNPVTEGSLWYTPDADYPAYDPQEAQRLFDEYAAEHGEVAFTLGAFQQTESTALAQFIQAALNQYEGVNVEVDIADQPTAFGRVLQRDYQAHLWGFPVLDADPGLYNALHSGLPTNVTGYANAEVDGLLDEARLTASNDERAPLYQQALTLYAQDMPFWHTLHPEFGYVYSDEVTGVELYEDGILRSDLLRRTE